MSLRQIVALSLEIKVSGQHVAFVFISDCRLKLEAAGSTLMMESGGSFDTRICMHQSTTA